MNSSDVLDGLLRDIRRYGVAQSDDPVERELAELVDGAPTMEQLGALGGTERAQLLHELVRLCVRSGRQPLLSQNNVAHPVYNFLKSFEENADGPWDREPAHYEGSERCDWTLFGQPIRYPIGVPASVMTANHKWVRYFARRGYNLITYKSVRSVEHGPHPYPHWVFLEGQDAPWSRPDEVTTVVGDESTWPKSFDAFSTANSFGVPSPPPKIWQLDVERSREALLPGQLLIVSVMGTAEEDGTALVRDFAKVARYAADCGAHAVELNLSCPNTVDPATNAIQGPVCTSAPAVGAIVDAVRESVSDLPLSIKLSHMPKDRLADVIAAVANKVEAVAGINTVQMHVEQPSAAATFPGTVHRPNDGARLLAGVSGVAIRDLGHQFVERLSELRAESGASFDIIAMGGVMSGRDVVSYRQRGADAVQSATAALVGAPLPQDAERWEETYTAVTNSLGDGLWLDLAQVASVVGETPSTTRSVLEDLVEAGVVTTKSDSRGRISYTAA